MLTGKMTSAERSAVASLSSIMALRMIGLFMVLPVFALYAKGMIGATPALIGLSMGIYGLTQAIFQIPFGSLSDKYGRKPIILIGLVIFIIGSILAASAHSISLLIIGRALQGAGAVGSTILATMADLTREDQRTKSMAIAGMTIGFSFSLAMLLGPILSQWMALQGLFLLAGLFGLCAILILYKAVPTPPTHTWHRDTEPELNAFFKLLVEPALAKLNIGIFILHAIFTASFVVIPISLDHYAGLTAHDQWKIYLPTLLIAFVVSLIFIGIAEKRKQLKPFFMGGIFTLALAELLLWSVHTSITSAAIGVCLFFAGFSLLEAFLPSLVSRTAPAGRKGTAMGIYSCSQFLGIFVGGVIGGWLYGKFSFTGVYVFCIVSALTWLVLASLMKPPRYLVTQVIHLSSSPSTRWQEIIATLKNISGIVDVSLITEESALYIKMEPATLQQPDFIRLKEQLQSDHHV